MIKKYLSVCMYSTGYCCQILITLEFSGQIFPFFFLNNRLLNFIEIRPVGAELFCAGIRTDVQT